ncbi:MAG TPA: sigma-70 family RNA polymerase sigma factor [Acidobacteriota bacterium]|nr:sigma-70 family RNA polymerase sigma factor [Acidobacteriota bacterium]
MSEQAKSWIEEFLEGAEHFDPKAAQSQFLEIYSPILLQVVRKFAHDEDEVSEGFVFVSERLCRDRLRRLRRFDPRGPARFETWLRVVVRNLCLDWKRSRSGRFRFFKSIAKLSRPDRELFRRLYREGMGLDAAFETLRPLFPGWTRAEAELGAGRIAASLSARERALLEAWRTRAGPRLSGGERSVEEYLPAPQADPETAALKQEQLSRIREAVKQLPARQRLLLRLRFEKELTLSEVARLTGLPNPQKADREIRKALNQLRTMLRPRKK